MTRRLLSAAVLFGAAALAASPAIAAMPCGNLTGLALPNNTTVDTATSVPAGPGTERIRYMRTPVVVWQHRFCAPTAGTCPHIAGAGPRSR